MSNASAALPLPEIYYEPQSKDYYFQNDRNWWIRIHETSAKRQLKLQGYVATSQENEHISPLDRTLAEIQRTQDVSYAAPLAGYDAGIYDIHGNRILVTDSPRRIQPVEGDWPLIRGILEGMFNDPVHDQTPHVYGWFKVALESLSTHQRQPGQALALAGPIHSAKSLFQALVTELLGGRVANPYQIMTGATAFNADLFAAEHLMIEDAAESVDIRTRRQFGAHIKGFAVNRDQRCHGKNRTALTLTPFWRVTISLNDDPERLLVLPPINDDIADKIILLKVRKRPMPMPTDTAAQQSAFWTALTAELPAFTYFLSHWEIPAALRSSRFGITHYHHPELLAGLKALSPEQQLLEMIDEVIFYRTLGKKTPWVGSALQLQSALTDEDSGCRRQAQALLHSAVACGTYLARLVTDVADRVSSRRINGRTQYTIQPPAADPIPAARNIGVTVAASF